MVSGDTFLWGKLGGRGLDRSTSKDVPGPFWKPLFVQTSFCTIGVPWSVVGRV